MSNAKLLKQAIEQTQLDADGVAANKQEIISWLREYMPEEEARQLAAKAARRKRGYKIRPHKGGRDDRLNVRISPELKARLVAYAASEGKSASDIVIEAIENIKGL